MKTLSRLSFVYLLWGLSLIICSCGPIPKTSKTGPTPDPSNTTSTSEPSDNSPTVADTQAIFSVDGLTCTSCEADITARVAKLEGVTEVEADHTRGGADTVKVRFDSKKTTAEAIKKVIERNRKFRVGGVVSKAL